jgi:hypothetical protein
MGGRCEYAERAVVVSRLLVTFQVVVVRVDRVKLVAYMSLNYGLQRAYCSSSEIYVRVKMRGILFVNLSLLLHEYWVP